MEIKAGMKTSGTEGEVREIRKEDLPALLRLYRELLPEDPPGDPGRLEPVWRRILSLGDFQKTFVAAAGGVLAAACTVTVIPNLTRGGRPYALVENVITAGVFRRQGYGRQVLDRAVEWARRENCYKVMLLSSRERTGAHGFYRAAGFDGEGKQGFQLRLP